jgi:hypothetical protein
VHPRELPAAPPDARLPLLVAYARDARIRVVEGMPVFEELRALIRELAGPRPP